MFLPLGTRLSVAETVRRWAPLLSHPAAPVVYHGAVSYVGWFWCNQLSPQLINLLENPISKSAKSCMKGAIVANLSKLGEMLLCGDYRLQVCILGLVADGMHHLQKDTPALLERELIMCEQYFTHLHDILLRFGRRGCFFYSISQCVLFVLYVSV